MSNLKRLIRKGTKILLKNILTPKDAETYGYNTDYGNRAFAISYIDGKLYEGDVHKDTVEQYLNDKNIDTDIIDSSEGFVTSEEQEDIDLPMAFASYVKGTDGKDYIAIYPDSIYNIGLNEFISVLKQKYSSAIICIDNNNRYNCAYEDAYIETN